MRGLGSIAAWVEARADLGSDAADDDDDDQFLQLIFVELLLAVFVLGLNAGGGAPPPRARSPLPLLNKLSPKAPVGFVLWALAAVAAAYAFVSASDTYCFYTPAQRAAPLFTVGRRW